MNVGHAHVAKREFAYTAYGVDQHPRNNVKMKDALTFGQNEVEAQEDKVLRHYVILHKLGGATVGGHSTHENQCAQTKDTVDAVSDMSRLKSNAHTK